MKRRASIIAILLLSACPADDGGAAGTENAGSSGGGIVTTGATPATTVPDPDGDGDSDSDSGGGDNGDTTTSVGDTGMSCADDVDCDNGDACDGAEACVDNACVSSPPLDCADAQDCTVDSCDPKIGCVNEPEHSRCGCGETCDPVDGCGNTCVPADCNGTVFQCGDCLDNEKEPDCLIDSADPDCWGPCDNNESGFDGDVPGQQNQSTCLAMDCYFDFNSGAGNDGCYWSHSCDPLEPMGCEYDANANIPGTGEACETLFETQAEECLDSCIPNTPNGCDCFGCCEVTIDDETQTIYLGTQDAGGEGTCTLDVVDDPKLCHPCTQVEGCFNPCGECELCLGVLELPDDCDEQECPPGIQQCGLAGQEPCPDTFSCITGCCFPNPQ